MDEKKVSRLAQFPDNQDIKLFYGSTFEEALEEAKRCYAVTHYFEQPPINKKTRVVFVSVLHVKNTN